MHYHQATAWFLSIIIVRQLPDDNFVCLIPMIPLWYLCEAAMSKTRFTTEQKQSLVEAFDKGLTSAKRDNSASISKLANDVGVTTSQVKVN